MAQKKSILGADLDMGAMSELGAQMLASGQVSPEEVQTAMTAADQPDQTRDWLSNYLGQANKKNPYTMKSEGKAASAPLPKGTQAKTSETAKRDTKTSQTRNLNYAPEEFMALAETAEQLPYIQDQRQGIQEMENLLSMTANRPTDESDYWVRPLINLTDSMTGSKLMSGYKAPESSGDKYKKLLDMKDDIQKRKSDLSKTLLEGISKMKAGTQTDSTQLGLAQMMGFNQGANNSLNDRMALADRRAADIAHRQTVQAIKNNKPLAQRVAQYQNLGNALTVLTNADKVTPQQLHEAQQAIRSNIGIKGTGGVEERKETYYNSLGLNAANWVQFLTNKPQDIKGNKELMKHVKELALLEQANIEAQYNDQLSALAEGHDWVYSDPQFSHYKKSLDKLVKAQAGQFVAPDRNQIREKVHAGLAATEPPKKASASSPGRTKPLEEMTDAELEAYEKSLKGGG